MKLKIVIVLLLGVLVSSCGKKTIEHAQAPLEFNELIEKTRTMTLQLPDSLLCEQGMRVRIDETGHLYAELVPNYLIGKFDSIGHAEKLIGQRGFGFGELTKILDFRVTQNGQIYVMDALTEDISLFDRNGGWMTTYRPTRKQSMTFEILKKNIVFFRRDAGERKGPHIVITPIGTDRLSTDSTETFLDSGDESIRTHMLVSQALATNDEGTVVFAFMAAKSIYVISAKHELSEIDIDPSSYRILGTEHLWNKYQVEKSKAFLKEVFDNSRVMSLGFVSSEDILMTFTTGRHEDARFYCQLYCLSAGRWFSRAYQTPSPVFYVGNHTFASWTSPVKGAEGRPNNGSELTLYTFRSKY